ncbi:hypothetical protein CH330_02185 [candidate division WOR-3 bacterium JGI_Cruoil_03_51_56]|uniref:N-acetyltransferase domain-containing protein n=1 Tax=candidate division WOR-3 bacterium JGI_Cruoil_03_51_56 TaxID=1973747 RepID=A0A235BWQ3_UNCW3|nr:MAG: hypothetical protein CH330_02185 [candidate division WOR-3 bacterium JGI_Cruoil_03_51_56]
MIRVKKVASKSDLNLFARLGFKVYQDFPNWVPPLTDDLKKTLTPGKNPFWNHAERELFLAEKDGEIAGRIAAIVDRNYNRYHNSSTGFFGFFESIDDYKVAESLFETTVEYCRSKGMSRIFGPANPSLNDEVGFLVDGFNSPPFIKMSYNPEYYIKFVEGYGFTKVKDLYAYIVPVNRPLPDKLKRVMRKLREKPGLVVRLIDLKNLEADLERIKEIYNDAWSDNWDFAPMTSDEIDDLAYQLKPLVRPEICPIVIYKNEPAGMSIALPDYNQVLEKMKGAMFPFGWLRFLTHRSRISQCRLWALGVKRKFHSLGFDSLLYYESFRGARKLGIDRGEVSWILEDNQAIIRPIRLLGGRIYKTYRVYQKTIVG